jgi:anti-sigma factor RsiW
MTCQEFTDQLLDYLDETLDAAALADAHRHLEACRECQFALRRAHMIGRSLQSALEHETAHLALAPDTRETILRAARSMPMSAERSAWQWLFQHPLRACAAAATLAAVLFVTGQLQRQRSEQRAESDRTRTIWSIDVPFQSGGQVGVIHADSSGQ